MDIPSPSRWTKDTRYYELSLQRDLWGRWCLVRAWGGVGRSGGRCASTPADTLDLALEAHADAVRRRIQRGYQCGDAHAR